MNKNSKDARHSLANDSTAGGTGLTPEDIVPMLEGWERPQVEELVEYLKTLLDDPEPDPEAGSRDRSPPGGGGATKTGGGWVELRTINGCGPYAYQRWWDGKRKRSKYIGKVQKEGAA